MVLKSMIGGAIMGLQLVFGYFIQLVLILIIMPQSYVGQLILSQCPHYLISY